MEGTIESDDAFSGVYWRLLSGGIAGAVSRTLTAPIERVKVVLQVQSASNIPEAQRYKGIWDCLIRIPQQQGFLGYWRGNGVNVVRMIPNSAIKFTTYDYYKSIAFPKGEENYKGAESFLRKMMCGGLSGATTLVPVYPLDLARTRLSADTKGHYKSLPHMLRYTISKQGFLGLYSGFAISLCGIIPYLAISFACYDHLKQATSGVIPADGVGKLFLGSSAAIFGQSVAYPIDTIRRHMQVSGGLGQREAYNSAFTCMNYIYSRYGWSGFYRGLLANITRAAPQAGLEFACFDIFSSFLLRSKAEKAKRFTEAFGGDEPEDSKQVSRKLIRHISVKMPGRDGERLLALFNSMQEEPGGTVSRQALERKLVESGFSTYQVQFTLASLNEASTIDFVKFREICKDKQVLELLEQRACE